MKNTVMGILVGALLCHTAMAAQSILAKQTTLLDDDFDNNALGTDVNGINGGFQLVDNGVGGTGSAAESGTQATLTTSAGVNNHTGIESLSTFNAGEVSGFTVTWVIDSADAAGPGDGSMSFAADSDSGLWGNSVYLQFRSDGKAIFSSAAGGARVEATLDQSVDTNDLADGFTISITYDTNGVSWVQSGIPSFHTTLSKTWDDLNGSQSFDYDDVFGSAVRVSAWRQTGDGNADAVIVDRVKVFEQGSGLDDHFDNNNLGTDVNGINGGFKLVSNGVNGSGAASESGTLATFTAAGINNNSGIESLNTFNATKLDSFTITWVVDSAATPEGNGLLFAADSDTGLWGSSVYFSLNPSVGGRATFISQAGAAAPITILVDAAVTMSDLTNGFTLNMTYDTNGVSWTQTGIASLHASASKTWDDLNGNQTFGYSDVFDSTVHVSAWNQTSDTIPNSISIDRITVAPPPPPTGTLILIR